MSDAVKTHTAINLSLNAIYRLAVFLKLSQNLLLSCYIWRERERERVCVDVWWSGGGDGGERGGAVIMGGISIKMRASWK